MKLLRVGPPGREIPAMLGPDGRPRSLADHLDDIEGEALSPASLDRLRALDPSALPALPAGARIGPCVARPSKIVCIGLNYRDHAAESGLPVPEEPVVFLKGCRPTGPDDPVPIPPGATRMDWEVELAVVIGTRAWQVEEDEALSHVAGYAVLNDISERAFQHERGGQWTKGKSAPGFAPLGPWLVAAEAVPDPQRLRLSLAVNGRPMQDGSTADMIFPVRSLISYVSRFMELLPGDILSTGTPAGVGAGLRPPVFLGEGDTMVLEIETLGRQSQRVVGEGRA